MAASIETTTTKEACPQPTIMGGWLRDWAGKLTLVYASLVIFHLVYDAFHWGGEGNLSTLVSNILAVAIYSGPCIFAWRLSLHPNLPKRSRMAWRLISLANCAFFSGEAIWLYLENGLGLQPFPSLADVGYLLFYPFLLAGMLLLVERFKSGEEKLNFWLDAGVILAGGGIVVWYVLLRPIAASGEGDLLKTGMALAYPVADLVLLLGISSLLLRRSGFGNRASINLLLSAVVINLIGDLVFGYQNISGNNQTGNLLDVVFTFACFPVILAANLQYRMATLNTSEALITSTDPKRFFWVPYAAVACVYSILLEIVIEERNALLEWAMVAAGLVTFLVIFRQFTLLRETANATTKLSDLQERIQGIYSASIDAIGLADLEGTITEVNDSFLRLTGFDRDDIVGIMHYTKFVPDDYLERTVTPEAELESGRSIEYERELIRKDGTCRTVTTTLYTVNGSSGKPAAVAIIIRDVSERRLLEQRLTHQALHDALTGLANRTALSERVERALSRARRRNSRVAILVLDLDNFKPVNDNFGHAAGDTLLITVAGRLRECIRASDTAARLGGDEFAVLIEDICHPGEEVRVAQRILQAVRTPVLINEKEVFVGSSIGIALSSEATQTSLELIQNADVAMYAAKRKGKNDYAVFEDEMRVSAVRRAQVETKLRSALEREEFQILYQPIVGLGNEQIVGMEALLRWNDPDGWDIGPSEFIPIAEDVGIITPIGEWVLINACSKAARWLRTHRQKVPLTLTVNISSRQLMDPTFIHTLITALKESQFPANGLVLEITEGLMLNSTDNTIEKLDQIKQLGVRFAIDDFGTGYSSLSYLHKFPIDVLKIDKSFVEKVSQGKEGTAMARAIISMSETLRLTTIAEGIESADQIEILAGLGCEWGQGYYFVRPLDEEDMERYLERQLSNDSNDRDVTATFRGDINQLQPSMN